MQTGTAVALAVGGIVVVGGAAFFLTRKGGGASAPPAPTTQVVMSQAQAPKGGTNAYDFATSLVGAAASVGSKAIDKWKPDPPRVDAPTSKYAWETWG